MNYKIEGLMYYIALESSTVELKQEIPKNDQIIKTIIGFCNQNGGKLVIGVNNDGTIIGISDKKINAIMEHIDKAIYESSFESIHHFDSNASNDIISF